MDNLPVQNPRELDSQYRTFPPVKAWATVQVGNTRWSRYLNELSSLNNLDNSILKRALDIAGRAAAVETGAIEGLYETDRGFTFSVALQSAEWELAFEQRDHRTQTLIQSQISTYDYVLDLATRAVPIGEAMIREIHVRICGGQDTYLVQTPNGPQEQVLEKGRYKVNPNHVIRRDGTTHAYCPVDLVSSEMHRFVEILQSDDFDRLHPIVQASFAHFALVTIHPFADGNGRVARALGSVFTYRAARIPMLILADQRSDYFDSLALADDGRLKPFIDFVGEALLDGMLLVRQSVETAQMANPQDLARQIESLYTTRGGYSHEDVDKSGKQLSAVFTQALREAKAALTMTGALKIEVKESDSGRYPVPDGYRMPMSSGTVISISAATAQPAATSLMMRWKLGVPTDCGKDDDLILKSPDDDAFSFAARIGEVFPTPRENVKMRARMAADAAVASLLENVLASASAQIGRDVS